MTLLQYEGKYSRDLYDITTLKQREKAFELLFTELDEWGVYVELNKEQKALYKKAKKGDFTATEQLLWIRSNDDYQYESISITTPIDPLEVDES